MLLYKSFLTKILFVFSIVLSLLMVFHVGVTFIVNNIFYYSTIAMYTAFFISLMIITSVIVFYVVNTKKTNKIYKTLLDDCNPLEALNLISESNDDMLTKKSKMQLNHLNVLTLFRLGKYEEAQILLEQKVEVKKTLHILWEHNKIMNKISLNMDISDDKKNFLTLKTSYPSKKDFVELYYQAQLKYYNLNNYNFEKLDEYYEYELQYTSSLAEKVSYNCNLAKIYYFQKNYQKAQLACNFVIENGNTMFAVEEAKQILKEIQ